MKVLLATPLYPPDTGGPATDAALLEKKLPECGITATIYSFGTVRHLPTGIRHVVYAYGLYKRVRTMDCIVAMDTFSVCLPSALIAKLSGKFFVIRVPGDFAWEQATQRFGVTDTIEIFQQKRYGFMVELLRTMQQWAVRQADLVVTCSDFLKKIVATWGVAQALLTRIYLGVEFNEPTHPLSAVPEGKVIFSLGRFVPWKGFAMLITLLSELPKEWRLVIAGDGFLRPSLEAQSCDQGVTERVTFTGVIPRPEILGWYRRASVFMLNSSQENFSFQVLEAMASGTPVIATTAGSIPELVRDGIDGILCPPNDIEMFKKALVSIQTEPLLWQRRVAAAHARALEFSVQRSVGIFAETLKKVCG